MLVGVGVGFATEPLGVPLLVGLLVIAAFAIVVEIAIGLIASGGDLLRRPRTAPVGRKWPRGGGDPGAVSYYSWSTK